MLMSTELKNNPIGVFDSGLGGISVLRSLKKLLPAETFIYYADSSNAPYGKKTDLQIFSYTERAVKKLVHIGCKAVVIACNTATAVAANQLRKLYDIPIIGLEPALKPAKTEFPFGKILVLATPVTLKCEKFDRLFKTFGTNGVYTHPLAYLVEIIESGQIDNQTTVEYLKEEFSAFKNIRFDACVLGCTHFPFATDQISKALGYAPAYFDGAQGAANKLKQELLKRKLLCKTLDDGLVLWNTVYPFNIQNTLLHSNI